MRLPLPSFTRTMTWNWPEDHCPLPEIWAANGTTRWTPWSIRPQPQSSSARTFRSIICNQLITTSSIRVAANKQGQTVHNLQIYIYTYICYFCVWCVQIFIFEKIPSEMNSTHPFLPFTFLLQGCLKIFWVNGKKANKDIKSYWRHTYRHTSPSGS